jgi:DNA ligase-1
MGIELGIGESLIIKAIAQSTGRKSADIKADLLKVGDLGLVAEVSFAMLLGEIVTLR